MRYIRYFILIGNLKGSAHCLNEIGKAYDYELLPWPGVFVAKSWVLQTFSQRGTFE